MIKFYNTIYNTNPIIFHANGDPKKSVLWTEIKNLCTNEVVVPGNLQIVTFNNGSAHGCKNIGSLEKSIQNQCTVMGSNIIQWKNIYKLSLVVDFLQYCKTEYVLSLDSSDIVIFSLQDIINKFLEKKCDILFNAEMNCWPKEYDNEKGWFREPFCYLNAGCCIGKRESLLKFYQECLFLKDINGTYPNSEQKIVKINFYKWYPKILIDDDCTIFQTLNRVTSDMLSMNLL